MTTMLDYALAYARRGWKVFPLAVRDKVPLIKGGNGCLDATTEREQILKWWAKCPSANIGIATGESFFVLDIDPKNNGNLWLETVELPDTIQQQTGSGGTHYLFSGPPDIPNSSGKIAPGVDIRGFNGYIVAPPSIHPNGNRYTWVDCEGIPTEDPSLSPGWLMNAAGEKKKNGMPPVPKVIQKGTQHDTIFRFASSMWAQKTKFTEDEVMAAAMIVSKRCEEVPPEENVVKIVHSVTRKYEPGLSPEYAAKLNGHHKETPSPQEEQEPDETPLSYVPWPEPLSEAAFHGPVGELCKIIEPHTEADIAAVLFQTLIMVGNILGRSVFWNAEGTQHFCNEFACIVGATAKGRKGSSYSRVRSVMSRIDRDWANKRTKSGLTSGEGLIFHVRDEIREIKQQKGQMVEVVVDAGEADKRLFIVEEELSSALKAMSREGNTLSGVLRQAWDSPTVLAPMTKNNRITATYPHVSIIGHITRDELLKSLKSVENTNGGTNRFLWCCAKRARLLPFGGENIDHQLEDVTNAIDAAIGYCQMNPCEVHFNAEAREMWSIIYEELGTIPGGTVGAILSRAEAHVRRIATIYAALDRSSLITPENLEAALEIWRYSSASVRWIFGGVDSNETVQDATREKIFTFISRNPEGVNRRGIKQYMGSKIPSHTVEFHLSQLLSDGKIGLKSERRTRQLCDYYYPHSG